MILTVRVVRQSAMKINTITVTRIIPSIRLWMTVSVQNPSGSSVVKGIILTSFGRIFFIQFVNFCLYPFKHFTGVFSFSHHDDAFDHIFIHCPCRPTQPGFAGFYNVATFLTSIGTPLILVMIIFSISLISFSKPIPRTT